MVEKHTTYVIFYEWKTIYNKAEKHKNVEIA